MPVYALHSAPLAIGRGQRRHAAAAGHGPCGPGRPVRQVPRRTGPGRLPKHRACAAASPCGRRGGRPASCRTTCARPAPGARHSRGDRRHALCPCTGRGPGRAGRSWAGCRSGASWRTAASTADTAAPQPAAPRGHAELGVGLVAVAYLLGEVLGQVADAPGGVLGPGEHALGVEPDPEPGHMPRLIVGADGVERLVPGRQDFPGGRVEVAADGLVPDRQLAAVVLDLASRRATRPGGRWRPAPGAARRGPRCRGWRGGHAGRGALGFDGGEVLHVVAEVAAQVLDEPVEQRGEGQRVPRRPVVVVGARVGRGAVLGRPGRRTGRSG